MHLLLQAQGAGGIGDQQHYRMVVAGDQLGNGRRTRIEYLSRQVRRVPESWLNPMALVRNPTLE